MLAPAAILTLAEAGIKTLDDLADLDTEELMGYLGDQGLNSADDAGSVIMAARAHWFEDEDEAAEEAAENTGEEAGDDVAEAGTGDE